MKHCNRQADLQYLVSQQAEKPSYISGCICFVDKRISTYFQINHAFICFILPLQINLTVIRYLNHYEASEPTRRATIPSKPGGRDAVLFVRLYMLCRYIYSTLFQINFAFISFIFRLQISLIVL